MPGVSRSSCRCSLQSSTRRAAATFTPRRSVLVEDGASLTLVETLRRRRTAPPTSRMRRSRSIVGDGATARSRRRADARATTRSHLSTLVVTLGRDGALQLASASSAGAAVARQPGLRRAIVASMRGPLISGARCSTAAHTPTRRWSSTTPRRTARAASSSSVVDGEARASSRARSSSRRTRRRPTAA